MQKLLNVLRVIRAFYYLRSFHLAVKIGRYEVNPRIFHPDKKSGKISVTGFGIKLSREKHLFFLEGYRYAKSLKELVNAQFYVNEDENIIIELNGVRAIVQTAEDLYILNEIFVDEAYCFISDSPVVVWDIGMNIGLASLYFVSRKNAMVVGYEPFKETYEQALRNFDLNPEISKGIRTFNYGVGNQYRKVTLDYCYEYKGDLGIWGIPERLRDRVQNVRQREITIKNAPEIIDSIVSDYPRRDIIAKIDCEGSEYEIIAALSSAGKLNLIKVIMMEWHRDNHAKGPTELTETLLKAGFVVSSLSPNSQFTGMIYAVRV